MNRKRIERAIKDILIAIGEDPKRQGLVDTPSRVARMYEEILSGIGKDAGKEIKIQYAEYDEIQVIFMKNLRRDAALYNDYHAQIVELSKNYCRAKPLCTDCPVRVLCRKKSL